MEEQKYVTFQDYDKAMDELRCKVRALQGERKLFYIDDDVYMPGDTVLMKINWSCVGAVSINEGKAFAENILKAIQLAENFKYNGYIVK